MNSVAAWKYTEHVDEARRAVLAAPGSFEEIIRFVKVDARVTGVRTEPGRDEGLRDCLQPIFTIELPNAGDPLFNGPWGYRAQYWMSAGHGLAANTALVVALFPKLLDAVDITAVPDLMKIDLRASLHAASAKIWIQEIPSLLKDAKPDLDVERWASEARRGVPLACTGLLAPMVTVFEVKGALIDPYGNEVVPRAKVQRHYDIHQYGFS